MPTLPQPDVGTGNIRIAAGTQLTLQLTCAKGAVIAVGYDLAEVGDPPATVDERSWDGFDFVKTNPRTWTLPELSAGRYRGTVASLLQPPKTLLEVAVLDGNKVLFRQTADSTKPIAAQIKSFRIRVE